MRHGDRPAANLLRACCDIRMFDRNTKMLISVFPSVPLRPENLESVRPTQTGESGISPSHSDRRIWNQSVSLKMENIDPGLFVEPAAGLAVENIDKDLCSHGDDALDQMPAEE